MTEERKDPAPKGPGVIPTTIHDPLCLADPATDNSRCHYCVLIAKVRQDMLNKCISGIELWPAAALRQRTKLDGTKEPLRFLIDKADVLEVLHRLQEQP